MLDCLWCQFPLTLTKPNPTPTCLHITDTLLTHTLTLNHALTLTHSLTHAMTLTHALTQILLSWWRSGMDQSSNVHKTFANTTIVWKLGQILRENTRTGRHNDLVLVRWLHYLLYNIMFMLFIISYLYISISFEIFFNTLHVCMCHHLSIRIQNFVDYNAR